MPRVSTSPISPRRFCSTQPRHAKRSTHRARGGPFSGRLIPATDHRTLVFTAKGQAGHYAGGVWIAA